jgi:hypothetical protein
MKTISQTLIMSWLGKNYQWAMVEGSSGLSALGEGGILKGLKWQHYRLVFANS